MFETSTERGQKHQHASDGGHRRAGSCQTSLLGQLTGGFDRGGQLGLVDSLRGRHRTRGLKPPYRGAKETEIWKPAKNR